MPFGISATKYIFWNFYLKFLLRKMTLNFCNFSVRFCSGKNLDIFLKNIFCDTYNKRHKIPLRHFSANYFVSNDPPYCTLRSIHFLQKYIVNDKRVFRKNGIVGFIALRYLCHRHIFGHFLYEILGSQNRS